MGDTAQGGAKKRGRQLAFWIVVALWSVLTLGAVWFCLGAQGFWFPFF